MVRPHATSWSPLHLFSLGGNTNLRHHIFKREGRPASSDLSDVKGQMNAQIVELGGLVSGSVTAYSTQLQNQTAAMSRSCEDGPAVRSTDTDGSFLLP